MVKKETPKQKKKHQARRRRIQEGIFSAAKNSFGYHYISPFAIAIQTSSAMVAMLSSIAGLLGPLSQLFSSRLIEKYSRKKIVLHAVFWEFLMWIPFMVIAFLYYKGILTSVLPIFLMLSFAIYVVLSNIGGPAWFSWVGDIVDKEYRGRWFSKRNFILGLVTVVVAISASFLLDFFKKNGFVMQGFMILFGLALISRFISWKILRKQYEPKIKLKKKYYFSFWDFVIKSPTNNFGKFALFRSALAFAGSISGPLLAVYLLRKLQFSYPTYMIIIFSGTVFSLIFIEVWGRIADKYGNYKVLCITSLIIPLTPILWILYPSVAYLILIPSLLGGIAWAGFSLSAGNFIYDNVSKEKRGLAVSYYNMLWGIGVFLGAGVGALLIKFLTTSMEPIFVIFIIGSAARAIVMIIFLPRIKEVRKTKKIKNVKEIKNILLKETKPAIAGEIHELMEMKKYFYYK